MRYIWKRSRIPRIRNPFILYSDEGRWTSDDYISQKTRFLLNNKQVVDPILVAIEFAKPGDTLVPIAPSANILNIGKALVADKDIEVKIIGFLS